MPPYTYLRHEQHVAFAFGEAIKAINPCRADAVDVGGTNASINHRDRSRLRWSGTRACQHEKVLQSRMSAFHMWMWLLVGERARLDACAIAHTHASV